MTMLGAPDVLTEYTHSAVSGTSMRYAGASVPMGIED
jgi:hypothetical protein